MGLRANRIEYIWRKRKKDSFSCNFLHWYMRVLTLTYIASGMAMTSSRVRAKIFRAFQCIAQATFFSLFFFIYFMCMFLIHFWKSFTYFVECSYDFAAEREKECVYSTFPLLACVFKSMMNKCFFFCSAFCTKFISNEFWNCFIFRKLFLHIIISIKFDCDALTVSTRFNSHTELTCRLERSRFRFFGTSRWGFAQSLLHMDSMCVCVPSRIAHKRFNRWYDATSLN